MVDEQLSRDILSLVKLLPVVASHSQLGANLIDAIAIASMGVSPGEVPFPALEEEAFQSLPREEPDARCLMSGRGKQVREFLAGIYTNPAEANRVFESLFSHGNVHDVMAWREFHSECGMSRYVDQRQNLHDFRNLQCDDECIISLQGVSDERFRSRHPRALRH